MAAPSRSWERQLLAWASEGPNEDLPSEPVTQDARRLDRAYAHCDEIARRHSRTFYKASSLLPGVKRRSIRALYAFCRITDDLIDHAQGDPAANLAEWRARNLAWPEDRPERDASHDLVALAWADTRRRYGIPACYAEQLIQGVARDLVTTRYATFDDLAAYCYGVASTVGLMSMHIIGFTGRRRHPLCGQARRGAAGDQHSARRGRGLGGRSCLPAAGRAYGLRVERRRHRVRAGRPSLARVHALPDRAQPAALRRSHARDRETRPCRPVRGRGGDRAVSGHPRGYRGPRWRRLQPPRRTEHATRTAARDRPLVADKPAG